MMPAETETRRQRLAETARNCAAEVALVYTHAYQEASSALDDFGLSDAHWPDGLSDDAARRVAEIVAREFAGFTYRGGGPPQLWPTP